MVPVPALLAGAAKYGPAILGALGGLFGGRKKFHYPNIPDFSFTPNENDPELALLRRRALMDIGAGHEQTVNEIGRAGLLGSSAAFGVLGEQQASGNRLLEDVNSQAFGNQRLQALQLYRDKANFDRQLALNEQGQDLQQGGQERLLGLSSLGDIGQFLGGEINPNIDQSYEEYLKRKHGINSALRARWLGASDYTYDLPSRRLQ